MSKIKQGHELFTQWVIESHALTNHYYDQYLPYEFHLRMVANVSRNEKFNDVAKFLQKEYHISDIDLLLGCYGHDLLEDARKSYNDIKTSLKRFKATINIDTVCEIIYAVTDPKGRNKEEKATPEHYLGIKNQPGALFVKLCDRIANTQYGLMTGSSMVKKYIKLYPKFKEITYSDDYKVMFDYLEDLMNRKN